MTVRIDIYQDLICPWCYIGRHRLERALAERPELAIERRWQPFQLNPGMPREGMDRSTYLAAKFGNPGSAAQSQAAVAQSAARDGLELRLDRIRRTPNTLDAHRLVRRVADEGGAADEATAALYRAYFVDGRDIGDRAVLADIAAELGLTGAAAYLAGDNGAAEVAASDAQARRLGITAVPCFVFNRRYALAGAHEPPAFLPLLDLDSARLPPAAAE